MYVGSIEAVPFKDVKLINVWVYKGINTCSSEFVYIFKVLILLAPSYTGYITGHALF